jgi:hypothetical protein
LDSRREVRRSRTLLTLEVVELSPREMVEILGALEGWEEVRAWEAVEKRLRSLLTEL